MSRYTHTDLKRLAEKRCKDEGVKLIRWEIGIWQGGTNLWIAYVAKGTREPDAELKWLKVSL